MECKDAPRKVRTSLSERSRVKYLGCVLVAEV